MCNNLFAQSELGNITFNLDSSGINLIQQWKVIFEDNPEFANPNFDDSKWQGLESLSENYKGVRWYRQSINLEGELREFDFLAMNTSTLVSAYEIYWDGNLILQNGSVSNSLENEIAGEVFQLAKMPKDITTNGKHTIAIRLSNQNSNEPFVYPQIEIGYHEEVHDVLETFFNIQVLNGTVFFLAMLFNFAMFFGGGRHRAYLLFAIYCFVGLIDLVFTTYNLQNNINIALLPYFDSFYYIVSPLSLILLSVFFINNFEIPKRNLHIGIIATLSILLFLLIGRESIFLLSFYPIGLAIYAVKKRRIGSFTIFIGITAQVILAFLFAFGILSFGYTIGIIALVFCVNLSISRQIREQSEQLESSRLFSAKLETDLLKKNIQPHFLSNTLFSIISWIEESPQKAVELIQALADEFRLVNKIASKKEIPLFEEIKLCETHLELMSLRKDAKFKLEQINLPESEMVPPMIFHTLIENGLTHAFESGENGTFTLSCEKLDGNTHFKLVNNGSLLKELEKSNDEQISEGMGIRYIKTRLEECYPKKWEMNYGLKDGLWQVNILIKNKI
ncbi:MAG: hypothetical protein DWQ06_00880 [Calditrichaeota bacterium]|nr:MAG: hypothetical protein DWQ06_00880 [Calditrichota bacterium]